MYKGNGTKRGNYENIMSRYSKLSEKPRLTQSTLFLVQDIKTTKSAYTFDPLENAQQQAEELRLNINDEFIATHFGLYLYGIVSSPGLGEDPATTTPQLLTSLPYESLSAGQSVAAGNIYSGDLSVSVNNIKYIEKFDTRRFNKLGQGRFGTDANTNFNFNLDGMLPVQPLVTLSGSKKNDISLSLPEALSPFSFQVEGATQTLTYSITKIALRLYGLNAQNAAKFQS